MSPTEISDFPDVLLGEDSVSWWGFAGNVLFYAMLIFAVCAAVHWTAQSRDTLHE